MTTTEDQPDELQILKDDARDRALTLGWIMTTIDDIDDALTGTPDDALAVEAKIPQIASDLDFILKRLQTAKGAALENYRRSVRLLHAYDRQRAAERHARIMYAPTTNTDAEAPSHT